MAKAPKKKKKVIVLTPEEKFEQLITLKNATRCILRIQDEYNVYVKLAKEFAELSDDSFEGAEQCETLSEECRKKAEELKPKLPAEQKEDSQTVMTTAREQEEKAGNQKKGKGKWIALAVVVFLVAAAVCYKATPTRYYIAGFEHAIGMDKYAMESYAKLGDYKDSASKTVEMKKILLSQAKEGEIISFGKCKWVVLDKKDGKLFLAKDTAMRKLVFHKEGGKVTWENCSLRTYFNEKFIEKKFNPLEQELIVTSQVKAEDNLTYGTDAGNDTQDKVFILSSSELKQYHKILGDRARDMRLRTPGKEEGTTAYGSYLRKSVDYGIPVDDKSVYVRPAMWIQYK